MLTLLDRLITEVDVSRLVSIFELLVTDSALFGGYLKVSSITELAFPFMPSNVMVLALKNHIASFLEVDALETEACDEGHHLRVDWHEFGVVLLTERALAVRATLGAGPTKDLVQAEIALLRLMVLTQHAEADLAVDEW